MSSLQGTELAFSFNFLFSRELVVTVNTPVQERNTTYRNREFDVYIYTYVQLNTVNFAHQDAGIAMAATMR